MSFIAFSGAGVIGFMQELPWFYILIGAGVLFAATMKGLLLFDDWKKRKASQAHDEQETVTPDLEAIEQQRKADEERARLSRLWEADRGDGYIVGKLILASELNDAKTIYEEFLQSVLDEQKRHPLAPAYALASVLVTQGHFDDGHELLKKTEHSAGFIEASQQTTDPEEDYKEFFVKTGGRIALDEWIEKNPQIGSVG